MIDSLVIDDSRRQTWYLVRLKKRAWEEKDGKTIKDGETSKDGETCKGERYTRRDEATFDHPESNGSRLHGAASSRRAR